MVITAPISGFFADKYGFRPVSALGMFIFGCGALFQGLVYNELSLLN
jgi:MFS family permease